MAPNKVQKVRFGQGNKRFFPLVIEELRLLAKKHFSM
jgi:hypothetical protein